MPQRLSAAMRSRINVEDMRSMIAAGVPWNAVPHYDRMKGRADLIFLVSGFFYFSDYLHGANDVETATEIWGELRQDILDEHARYRPGSRPWSWWAIEDRPPRRRLTAQCFCFDLPDSPKFPPALFSWFGKKLHCQCEYESQADYLSRLGKG